MDNTQGNPTAPLDSNNSQPRKKPSFSTRFFNFIGTHHHVTTITVVLVITVIGSGLLLASHAATPALLYDDSFQPQTDAVHGVTYAGLGLRKTTAAHPCKGLFEAAPPDPGHHRPAVCTHGPDPAPYNVTKFSAALAKRVKVGTKINKEESAQVLNNAFASATSEDPPSAAPNATQNSTDINAAQTPSGQQLTREGVVKSPYTSGSFAPFSVPDPQCYGTGTDGRRVQLVYMHKDDQPDNFSILQSVIQYAAQKMDASMLNSTDTPGADLKRIRFVTDATCLPTILDIASTDPANFSTMIQTLTNNGYTDSNRIYEVFVDNLYNTNLSYCGLGSLLGDDTPGTTNKHNSSIMYSATYSSCWGYADAHELGHNLGAVQSSAPNTSPGHCLDGQDIMCYGDLDGAHGYNGREMSGWHCLSDWSYSRQAVYDCNHDDYFNTAHPKTGYLSNHWNIVNNTALQTVGTLGPTVGSVPTLTGRGNWSFNTQGNVVPSGDAVYYGSTLGHTIQGNIISLIPTTTGRGYTLTSDQGASYPFGDAVTVGPSQTATFTPSDDSYVVLDTQTNTPDSAIHGTEAGLNTNNPLVACDAAATATCDTRYHSRVFLKFTVTGITSNITSAYLYLYPTSSIKAPKLVSIYRTPDTSWSENTITWANQPTFINSPLPIYSNTYLGGNPVGSYQAVSLYSNDLSVKGNGTYTLILDGNVANVLSISSKEGGNPPKLIINYR